MKILLIFLIVTFSSLSFARGGTVNVRGYTKSNGTVVMAHHRTAPNNTRIDNWSTAGNVNPYTGKAGTHNYGTAGTVIYQNTYIPGVQPITYHYDKYID